MEKNLEEVEKPKRKAGGPQPGSGRPKGSTSKISSLAILAEIQKTLGKSYQEQLAENYKNALTEGNQKYIVAYDNIIINKCVVTAIEVDLTVTESDAVINKEIAFAAALKAFSDKDTNE